MHRCQALLKALPGLQFPQMELVSLTRVVPSIREYVKVIRLSFRIEVGRDSQDLVVD